MTIGTLRERSEVYIKHIDGKLAESTVKRKRMELKKMLSGDLKDSYEITEDVIRYWLRTSVKGTFDERKVLCDDICNFFKIPIDVKSIGYERKYILSISDLKNRIDFKEQELAGINKVSVNLLMCRMFLYLSWLGLTKEESNALTKQQYDKENHILHLNNRDVNVKAKDQLDIIHNELVANIESNMLKQDLNKFRHYVKFENGMAITNKKLIDKEIHILRGVNGRTDAFINELGRVCNSRLKINHKEVLEDSALNSLYIFEKKQGIPITMHNILDICKQLNIKQIKITNYKVYKELLNYFSKMIDE